MADCNYLLFLMTRCSTMWSDRELHSPLADWALASQASRKFFAALLQIQSACLGLDFIMDFREIFSPCMDVVWREAVSGSHAILSFKCKNCNSQGWNEAIPGGVIRTNLPLSSSESVGHRKRNSCAQDLVPEVDRQSNDIASIFSSRSAACSIDEGG